MIITATISRRPLWQRLLRLPAFGRHYRMFRRQEGVGILWAIYGAWIMLGIKVSVP